MHAAGRRATNSAGAKAIAPAAMAQVKSQSREVLPRLAITFHAAWQTPARSSREIETAVIGDGPEPVPT